MLDIQSIQLNEESYADIAKEIKYKLSTNSMDDSSIVHLIILLKRNSYKKKLPRVLLNQLLLRTIANAPAKFIAISYKFPNTYMDVILYELKKPYYDNKNLELAYNAIQSVQSEFLTRATSNFLIAMMEGMRTCKKTDKCI